MMTWANAWRQNNGNVHAHFLFTLLSGDLLFIGVQLYKILSSDSDAILRESHKNVTNAAPGDNISTHNTTDVTSEGVAVDFLVRWKLQNLEYLLPGSLLATLVSYYAMAGFLQYYYYYKRREQVTGAASLGFYSNGLQ